MSSQKQCHRMRYIERMIKRETENNYFFAVRCAWLERRPAWWKPWEVKKWKMEEPK